MSIATLSSKFQISIPKEARESLGWRAGQKLVLLRVGNVLKLVAQPTIDDLAGIAAGKDGEHYRDRSDRTVRAPTARR